MLLTVDELDEISDFGIEAADCRALSFQTVREEDEYFTCPRSRPYRLFRRSDLRVNALYAEHEFIWILATWPWGLRHVRTFWP